MTKPVCIILTVQIGERKEIKKEVILPINPIPAICAFIQEFAILIIQVYLSFPDDQLQADIPKGVKNVGTEWRTFVSEFGKIRFLRRVYKDASGKRIKPLDDVLGQAPYARRPQDEEIRTAVLAAKSNYRYAAWIESLVAHAITRKHISNILGRQVFERIEGLKNPTNDLTLVSIKRKRPRRASRKPGTHKQIISISNADAFKVILDPMVTFFDSRHLIPFFRSQMPFKASISG